MPCVWLGRGVRVVWRVELRAMPLDLFGRLVLATRGPRVTRARRPRPDLITRAHTVITIAALNPLTEERLFLNDAQFDFPDRNRLALRRNEWPRGGRSH